MNSTTPDRSVDVALAEFNSLRAEILNHITTQSALVGIGLTALGVIVGFVVKEKGDDQLLLAIPLLAALVNLLYAAETYRCNTIGTYIQHTLWPYLQERVQDGHGPSPPNWEEWIDDKLGFMMILVGAPALALFPAASGAALIVLSGLDTGVWIAGWSLTVIALCGPPALGAYSGWMRKREGPPKQPPVNS
jgi:hypothetical protein